MSGRVDAELKRALIDLQVLIQESTEKIKIIDSQLHVLKRYKHNVDVSQQALSTLPPDTKTYEPVGRMFLLTSLDHIKNELKTRDTKISARMTQLEINKQCIEKKLKDGDDNMCDLVQQKKMKNEAKSM